MSTIWTPSGEHQVPPDDADSGGPANAGAASPPAAGQDANHSASHGASQDSEMDPETAAAMEEQMRAVQEQMISVPSSQIVANHIIGFYELAILHLRRDPPALDQAQLPIDAMAVLLSAIGDRLEPETIQALTGALQQIQNAFIAAQNADET